MGDAVRQGAVTETQCFSYDNLDRLTQAWSATDNCAADPASDSGATIGDGIAGAAYWTTWTYSPLGLRTTETDHGLSGAADTTTSYTHNGNGTSQPDTLTGTSTTGPSSGSASYSFDSNGNVTASTVTAGTATTSQQLTWNDDGTLGSVTTNPGADDSATSSYIYDANGNLLLQKDPGTTTLYLPGEELTLNTSSGAVTGTRYYDLPAGGQVVRTGTASGTSYVFELTDQHGTPTLTIGPDLTAASATWRQYTPYGTPRGPAVTWVDNRGFLNQPADAQTSLTDLGARWYDPATGTFQSIDPVFEASSPEQQNGYSYAADNPLTNSDPTGLSLPGGSGCLDNPDCNGPGDQPNPGSNGGGTANYGSGGSSTNTQSSGQPGGAAAPATTEPGCNSVSIRYSGDSCTPVMPTTAPGGPLSFLAGIGDFFVGMDDPVYCFVLGGADCAEALASGDLPSQAYTNWVARQGIDTAEGSAFSSGQVAAGVLLLGAGGIVGAAASAADDAAAAAAETEAEAIQTAKQAAAEDTVSLADRPGQMQSSLTGRTARSTTTAVLRATTPSGDSQFIVATSEQYFRASWLNALQPGEIAVAGPDDAEINALSAAQQMGLTPQEIAASRAICLGCQVTLSNAGVSMLSPLKQYPAYGWLP